LGSFGGQLRIGDQRIERQTSFRQRRADGLECLVGALGGLVDAQIPDLSRHVHDEAAAHREKSAALPRSVPP
jgi:hypothetical protein